MNTPYFEPVTPNVNFPELEERMLQFWKDNKIFEKSISSRPADKTWTFLDGPPFITGLPHYGTLLSSIPKDLFPRFWTMKGYRVRRVWGWDVHGLPAENKVEQKLGIKRKKEIEEKIGIQKFIDECKLYVSESSAEWAWYVDHIARWVDFENAYTTMDLTYMETVMWVFKQMYEKGYIYKGLRVSLYCPHCSTPISNFEVAMDPDNYKEVTDFATTYKYQLTDEPFDSAQGKQNTYFLAWSTTPWNKIATPALAVNQKLNYIKVQQGGERYILAEATVKMLKGKFTIIEKIKGKDLVGLSFVPHYDYYTVDKGKQAFVVVAGDFVTADEGTGIVTIAAYGEDDLKVMQENNIHIEMHVDDEGKLNKNVPMWGGMYYLDVNEKVNEDLGKRGLIYDDNSSHRHTVPTCWRCHTRLIFAPQDAWYVNIQNLKEQMSQTNWAVNWYPKHFKFGRYAKSLESAPDWCISRSRYWGSPVPVWECTCGERFVPGSIAELEKRTGTKISDLHKPFIDEIEIVCDKCGKNVKRVPEVLDSWIEAGSASLAERHYPFIVPHGGLTSFFPPDFIVEYTGQIRAWFYVLHVISTALFGSHAFKNVVVTGVILGTDGRKMSKNYGNYPDPKELLQKYGGDALRLYLLGSPVMHGEDIRISEAEYKLQVRGMLLVLWNVYNFFVTNATVDGWKPEAGKKEKGHILDRWILSLLTNLTEGVTKNLEAYDTVGAIGTLKLFIDDLSTWYIRRSRKRVGPTAYDTQDKQEFYETCHEVLVTLVQLLAPFVPFFADTLYRNLTKEESVHLAGWPVYSPANRDVRREVTMGRVRERVERIHAMRKKHGLKVRQPLASVWFFGIEKQEREYWHEFEQLIKEEVNVHAIEYHEYREISGDEEKLKSTEDGFYLDIVLTNELRLEGEARDLVRAIQELRKEKGCTIDAHIHVELPTTYQSLSTSLISYIQKETLATRVSWGDHLTVTIG